MKAYCVICVEYMQSICESVYRINSSLVVKKVDNSDFKTLLVVYFAEHVEEF